MTGVGNAHTKLLDRRYRLVEPLGRGGMSVVWRGYDELLGRQVAVKVLNAGFARDRALRQRIRLEARAAARLRHPNITEVYDFGEAHRRGGGVPYVVMELIDGEALATRLRRDGSLPWREAVVTAAEVAAALAGAHARGIVHRDVTPGNIMLTPRGAKVVDFGISAVAGEVDRCDGRLLGTPGYLAPERIDEGQAIPASDVYALGLVLYRSLTGRLPWDAPTTAELLRAHLYAEPAPVPPVPGLPTEVAELCERCLAKDPAARPTSAEAAATLAAAVGVPVVPVSPAPVGAGTDLAAGTPVGTTILPWSTSTDAVVIEHRRAVGGRLWISATIAGLAAITGLVWGVTAHTPAAGGATDQQPTTTPMGAGTAPPCEVTYALQADTGRDFGAELTVTNRTVRLAQDWQLTFAFPDDQRITAGRSGTVKQTERDVVIRPAAGAAALAPGASAPVSLIGTYAEGNALPTRFELDGIRCEVRVRSLTSAPAARPFPTATTAARGGEGDLLAEARSGGKGKDNGRGKRS